MARLLGVRFENFDLDFIVKSFRQFVSIVAWSWALLVFILGYFGQGHYNHVNNHNELAPPPLFQSVIIPVLKVLVVAPSALGLPLNNNDTPGPGSAGHHGAVQSGQFLTTNNENYGLEIAPYKAPESSSDDSDTIEVQSIVAAKNKNIPQAQQLTQERPQQWAVPVPQSQVNQYQQQQQQQWGPQQRGEQLCAGCLPLSDSVQREGFGYTTFNNNGPQGAQRTFGFMAQPQPQQWNQQQQQQPSWNSNNRPQMFQQSWNNAPQPQVSWNTPQPQLQQWNMAQGGQEKSFNNVPVPAAQPQTSWNIPSQQSWPNPMVQDPSTVQHIQMNDDGRYSFSYNSADQSRQEERSLDGTVSGSYGYTAPTGQQITVDYRASPTQGYRAFGPTIPLQEPTQQQLPQVPQDTPEVQQARAEFFAAYDQQLQRIRDEAKARGAELVGVNGPSTYSENQNQNQGQGQGQGQIADEDILNNNRQQEPSKTLASASDFKNLPEPIAVPDSNGLSHSELEEEDDELDNDAVIISRDDAEPSLRPEAVSVSVPVIPTQQQQQQGHPMGQMVQNPNQLTSSSPNPAYQFSVVFGPQQHHQQQQPFGFNQWPQSTMGQSLPSSMQLFQGQGQGQPMFGTPMQFQGLNPNPSYQLSQSFGGNGNQISQQQAPSTLLIRPAPVGFNIDSSIKQFGANINNGANNAIKISQPVNMGAGAGASFQLSHVVGVDSQQKNQDEIISVSQPLPENSLDDRDKNNDKTENDNNPQSSTQDQNMPKGLPGYFYYVSVGGSPHYITEPNVNFKSSLPTSLKAHLLGAAPLSAVHDAQVPNRSPNMNVNSNQQQPILLELNPSPSIQSSISNNDLSSKAIRSGSVPANAPQGQFYIGFLPGSFVSYDTNQNQGQYVMAQQNVNVQANSNNGVHTPNNVRIPQLYIINKK